jgi:DNA excision repair protein ERCC-3
MSKPLIIQSDKTLLLEVDNPEFEECRAIISRFAELEKSPEYLHTYRISPLSLWNAASSAMSADLIIEGMEKYARYSIPKNVVNEIREQISRYGKVKLVKEESGELVIISNEKVSYKKSQTIEQFSLSSKSDLAMIRLLLKKNIAVISSKP